MQNTRNERCIFQNSLTKQISILRFHRFPIKSHMPTNRYYFVRRVIADDRITQDLVPKIVNGQRVDSGEIPFQVCKNCTRINKIHFIHRLIHR